MQAKNFLVLGLGESGLSMARWLSRHGAHLRVADSRSRPPCLENLHDTLPDAQVHTGSFDESLLEAIDFVALSPGLSPQLPIVKAAQQRGIPVMGDVELFARALQDQPHAKLIAITGTNGKTTVTALTGAMCRAAGLDTEVAGNISPAVLDALMQREDLGRMPEVWVLELSSFQLETTESLVATAATVLNLSEDHLDRHAGMAEYAEAKARVFQGGGAQVLNRQDRYSRGMQIPGRHALSFGLDPALSNDDFGLLKIRDAFWLAQGMTPLMPVAEMKLVGLHNAANALAALALTRAIGLPFAPLLDTLRRFGGLPHRVERAGQIDGVLFYDDSKGTNVGSTVAALEGFAREFADSGHKVVLIAGGVGKGQDFSPLQSVIAASARAVILIGRDASLIRAAIAASSVPLIDAADMPDAVARAKDLSVAGDVVLLSPACASFDMFDNYKHRGQMFCAAVQALGGADATH